MNRDRENRNIQEKLKQFFKLNSKTNTAANVIQTKEYLLTKEILKDLGKDASINTRMKAIRELSDLAITSRLEPRGVEKLWISISDLFLKEVPIEVRHTAFAFLQVIIQGQFETLGVMRAQFFRFIKHHDNPQDLPQRIDLLGALTNYGKEAEHFQEEIGPFLLNWFGIVNKVGKLQEYLKILDNVIKFNSTHIDENIMTGYVKELCVLCTNSDQYAVVILSLQLLGTVLAYSILPSESLTQFVGTLCRTVTVKCYCAPSLKTMKNLLGTHLGHSALFSMCRFLQEPNLKNDADLMRGCVFYIHVALWDANCMQNLCCPPSSVLPSILTAVKCNHASVFYEVLLGIQKLINKHGCQLIIPTWDIVLEILLHIYKQIELAPHEKPNMLSAKELQEIFNTIENLIEIHSYLGSDKQFFSVIHECAKDRPEQSVLKLIKYLSRDIRPTENGWLQNLYNLMANYFKPEITTNIRLKVLNILSDIIQVYSQYEEELIVRVVIPHMQNIHNDDNTIIRHEVGKLLVNLCLYQNTAICLDLLDILEKLLMRPYEKFAQDLPTREADFLDITAIIPGLIRVFSRKIHRLPSTHAVKIYKMFIVFLERHLQVPAFKNFNKCRLQILECFLTMRADSQCHLGYTDPIREELEFSSYLRVTHKPIELINSPPQNSPTLTPLPTCKITYMTLDTAFRLLLVYLEKEKDWEVLKMILEKLPRQLANKAIILTKNGNSEMNNLLNILCSMLQNRSYGLPETLNVKVTRLELQTAVVSVIVSLSSYGANLDQYHQQLMITTLSKSTGTDPRCSKQSINALTICMVDMRETMVKLLPDVLLRLSKISATTYIAMPILEFLSTLSQLPTVYGNFVGDQYMAVFAIALPYTNPFKYDNYIVSLAYHVISVWFLKCRLPFRKDFVKFIVSGLQTNVMVPFQELNQFKLHSLSNLNQDSSDRKRSSSLTEPSSRRRQKPAEPPKPKTFAQKPTQRDQTVLTFYEELNESCIDLMARYTYSPCSALPTRLPTAEFLLNGGISKSWMLGNKLITITTSGCTEKVLKHGVCDKCWTLCSSHNNSKIARYARSNSSGNSDDKESFLTRQNSSDKGGNNGGEDAKKPDLGKMIGDEKKDLPICACWCQGWAEILIRRPTGNISWVMKVQNQVSFKQLIFEFPLNEMASLYMPELFFEPNSAISIEEKEENEDEDEQPCCSTSAQIQAISVPGSPTKQSLSRQSSRDSGEDESEFIYDDDGTKLRNPVRRSNSSPEMANWKNPIVHHDNHHDNDDEIVKKNKKDVRVSCEAIPEEISGMGTSSPIGEVDLKQQPPQRTSEQQKHPNLYTCHSYPGSSPPATDSAKPYKTVPPSPNQITTLQPGFGTNKSNEQETNTNTVGVDNNNSNNRERVLDRPNNLPNLTNLVPLTTKPPQSPTQTSPRLQRHIADRDKDGNPIQKSSSSSKLERGRSKTITDSTYSEKRDRLHTISVMSTSSRKSAPPMKKTPKEILKSGLNPSFVFLQLYHSACFGSPNEVPLYVHPTSVIERAINLLDKMYPYEVHKIGVLYIHEGQVDKEKDILRNTFGCVRYVQFLQNLGSLIRLADVNPQHVFLGGLDQTGRDGKYMYSHQDDLVMLAFHVATLMPNKDHDPNGNYKKAHVGNDNVVIVYNNSGKEFDIATFKSQVTLAYIIVEPLDYNCNKVEVKMKSELLNIVGSNEVIIVSDQSVSILVRQLAIHADLVATVLNSLRSHYTDPYASNWLERLRKLKNLREKVEEEIKQRKDAQKGFSEEKDIVEDFTDFT